MNYYCGELAARMCGLNSAKPRAEPKFSGIWDTETLYR